MALDIRGDCCKRGQAEARGHKEMGCLRVPDPYPHGSMTRGPTTPYSVVMHGLQVGIDKQYAG